MDPEEELEVVNGTGGEIRLDGLCGPNSSFWDAHRTWYTNDPDLTDCFRKTVLICGPCFLFWLLFPLYLNRIWKRRHPPFETSTLTTARIIVAVCLILLAAVDAGFSGFQADSATPIDIMEPCVRIVTFLGIIGTIHVERIKGVRVSPFQWFFWLIYILANVVNLYCNIRQIVVDELPHVLAMVTFTATFLLAFASWCLHFYPDVRPEVEGLPDSSSVPCPEQSASFPSLLLFSWFTGFAWMGFKRSLVKEDLWKLPPRMRCSNVAPMFLTHWEKAYSPPEPVTSPPPPSNGDASFLKSNDEVQVEIKTGEKSDNKSPGAYVLCGLMKAFGCQFVMGSFLKFLHDVLVFASPLLLKRIINFASNEEEMWKGVAYACVLLVTTSIQSVMLAKYFFNMYVVGMWIKSATISAIYRKALKVSPNNEKDTSTGEVVNLMSVDTQRIVDMMPYLNMLWSAPLQIGLALFFLWQTLGPSVLSGFLVMVLLIPINGAIAAKARQYQVKQMKQKDQRVKVMNEVLQGIKILKLYAWESSFEEIVGDIRKKEIHTLTRLCYLSAGTSFIWSCAPFLVSLVTFATYVLSDPNNVLDSQKAFVSLSLFNILRFPLSMLPMMIAGLVQSSVSVKRIDKFMNSGELPPSKHRSNVDTSDCAITVKDGSFTWKSGDSESFKLSNINLEVQKGSLVAVVGSVGTGKSSLLSSFLGEMHKTGGTVTVNGTLSYAAQQAWIQNLSVKDNILFHKPFEESRYKTILDGCSLEADLKILPAGDKTEIGEKGINLSGGQKQRVSLARVAYSNSEIYLLDDPLSAVDVHVGRHIFDHLIGPEGLLSGKTRILVTHGITYLPMMDKIFVIKDGTISESGTYKELLAQKGAFADFMVQFLSSEASAEEEVDVETIRKELEETIGKEVLEEQIALQRAESESHDADKTNDDDSSPLKATACSPPKAASPRRRQQSVVSNKSVDDKASVDKTAKKNTNQTQYEAEKAETGKVSFAVYIYYIRSMGLALFGSCLLFFFTYQVCSAASSIWLSKWSDVENEVAANMTSNSTSFDSRDLYLSVYGGLGVGQAVMVVLGSLFLYLSTLKSARRLHDNMLHNVMRSPMSFFDTTPQGRILNRFGKDIDVLDNTMSMILRGWISCLLGVTSTFLIITYTTPIFILPISLMLICYYFVQRVYVSCSRQLKRLESTSRSPIYSHFGETVNGVTTIRAFKLEGQLIEQSEKLIDENQRANFPAIVANRWLAVRLEIIGNLIIFCSALLAVIGRDSLSPGLIGLSVSYALSVTQTLNWLVRMTSEVETNIVAAERLKEYTETVQEASWTKTENKPKEEWPEHGRIQFDNYSTRYREGLDLVLRDLSFEIEAGEKIGIVGRTGAGKSSLTLALFRIIEPAGGKILIDGINISDLGLHDLRNKLTIIPQDPVLFSGSLRMNLDPFDKYSDEELWEALKLAHLADFVSTLKEGLSYDISEGGENLSVGQRQLVCLARALLRKTKVLVLDEATAAIDLETDEWIQSTIRSAFEHCTVITIAHRLNTVIDYSKILVLSKGKRTEYDSPQNLLNDTSSTFYSMCKDAGLA